MSFVDGVRFYTNTLKAGPSNLPRTTAAFKALPWQSQELVNTEDLKTLSDKPSLSYLSAYVTELAKDETSEGRVKAQTAIRKFVETGQDMLSQQEIEAAFSVLMGYRLLDVALCHDGRELRSLASSAVVLIKHARLPLKRLEDCKVFLQEQCEALMPELKKLSGNQSPLTSTKASVPQDHHSRLFHKLVSRRKEQQIHTVLLNFETAAFYLSYLLKGHIDLPEKLSDLLNQLSGSNEDGRKGPHAVTLQGLKSPLLISMSVSPLCLLMGKDMLDGPGRKVLFEYWRALAPVQRPPAVAEAERELWGVVIDVARGDDCVERLHRALGAISAFDVEADMWIPRVIKASEIKEVPPTATLSLPTGANQKPTMIEFPDAPAGLSCAISQVSSESTTVGLNDETTERFRPEEGHNDLSGENVDDEIRRGERKTVNEPQPGAGDRPQRDEFSENHGSSSYEGLSENNIEEGTQGKGTGGGEGSEQGIDNASNGNLPTGAPRPQAGLIVGGAVDPKYAGINVNHDAGVGGDDNEYLRDDTRTPPTIPNNGGNTNNTGTSSENEDVDIDMDDTNHNNGSDKEKTGESSENVDGDINMDGIGSGSQVDSADESSRSVKGRDDAKTKLPSTGTSSESEDVDIDMDDANQNNGGDKEKTGESSENVDGDINMDGIGSGSQVDSADESSHSVKGRDGAKTKSPSQGAGEDQPNLRRSTRIQQQPDATSKLSEEPKPEKKKGRKRQKLGAAAVKKERAVSEGPGFHKIDDDIIIIPKPTSHNSTKILAETRIIDLTLYDTYHEEDKLIIDWDRPKVRGLKELEYPIVGSSELFKYLPEFHFFDDIEWWETVDACARENRSTFDSRICSMSHVEYEALTSIEVAQKLRSRHLVIYDIPGNDVNLTFPRALVSLGSLDRELTIYDFSVRVPEGASNSVRARVGTPLDMARSLRARHPKALNGLDFPFSDDPFPAVKFSSDGIAWHWCLDKPFCTRVEDKPVKDIRWGLAATSSARHDFHVDTAGLGTYIDPKCGIKVWVLLTPKNGEKFEFMGRIDAFLEGFSLSLPDKEKWTYDIVILRPGMRLVMRPNTVHAVLTPVPSVCHGGHFYATSTIRDTVYGLYHTFVASTFITNALHKTASELLLSRMLTFIYYKLTTPSKLTEEEMREFGINDDDDAAHLPDLNTFEGLLDLLAFCNFFELESVLADWMYRASQHSTVERKRNITNRSLARQLVDWVFHNYNFSQPHRPHIPRDQAVQEIAHTFLARQARALVCYKQRALEQDVSSEIPGCDSVRVERAVEDIMSEGSVYRNAYLAVKDKDIDTFAWTGSVYELERCSEFTPVDSTIYGETADDLRFDKKLHGPRYTEEDIQAPTPTSETQDSDEEFHWDSAARKRAHSTDGTDYDGDVEEPVRGSKRIRARR